MNDLESEKTKAWTREKWGEDIYSEEGHKKLDCGKKEMTYHLSYKSWLGSYNLQECQKCFVAQTKRKKKVGSINNNTERTIYLSTGTLIFSKFCSHNKYQGKRLIFDFAFSYFF